GIHHKDNSTLDQFALVLNIWIEDNDQYGAFIGVVLPDKKPCIYMGRDVDVARLVVYLLLPSILRGLGRHRLRLE
ncbi:hypothetical protein IMZ48_09910, partial [Candidatus Bathyarchaeota archaeon]|nr:hypothetical protein [Candidatus Bathyarchaeota archaeon]